jgi:lysozyme
MSLLAVDVQGAESAVSRLVTVPLTQGQFEALTSWTFNLGAGKLASSTALKCLNAGRYNDAVASLQLWNRAGGVVQPGLVRRRTAEAALWMESDTATAPNAPAAK